MVPGHWETKLAEATPTSYSLPRFTKVTGQKQLDKILSCFSVVHKYLISLHSLNPIGIVSNTLLIFANFGFLFII